MVQNILFLTLMYPFNAKDAIYCYTTYHMKAYEPHRNFLILTNNSPCQTSVKISAF